jgi:uncharacterized protein involved in type VI secretion and phage assembly
MSVLDQLIDRVRRYGIEGVFRRFYGMYIGIVEDVEDPEGVGRVRVRVPALGQKIAPEDIWARSACFAGSEGTGIFFPPASGDRVWVSFEAGNPAKPVYFGGMLGFGKAAAEFGSELKRGVKTPAGHFIRLSDDTSDEHITVSASNGAYATMNKDGDMLLSSKEGSYVNLSGKNKDLTIQDIGGAMLYMKDGEFTLTSKNGVLVKTSGNQIDIMAGGDTVISSGGKVTINAGSVDIGAQAVESVIKGNTFQALFNAHTHVTPVGPSGPPLPPLTGLELSTAVKTA